MVSHINEIYIKTTFFHCRPLGFVVLGLLLVSFPTTLPMAHWAHFVLGSLLCLELAEKLLSQYLVPIGLRLGWIFSEYLFSSFSAQSLWHRKDYPWSPICNDTTMLTTLRQYLHSP